MNNSLIQSVPAVVPVRMGGLPRRRGFWVAAINNPVLRPRTGTIMGIEYLERAWENLVVDEGVTDALDVHLSGGTQDTTWFIFLIGTTPTILAANTLASHAWTEVTGYDEATRQAWVDGGVVAKSVTNSASPAVFTITGNGTTVGGAGACGASDKGGTTGILYAAGAFSGGDVVLNAAATIDITATFPADDDGV